MFTRRALLPLTTDIRCFTFRRCFAISRRFADTPIRYATLSLCLPAATLAAVTPCRHYDDFLLPPLFFAIADAAAIVLSRHAVYDDAALLPLC